MPSSRRSLTGPFALPASLLAAVLFAVTLLTTTLVSAVPAIAHDAAEGSTPSNGEVVASVPARVSVTFNNNPLGLGASMSVKDSSGNEWADGGVQITDNVASQTLLPGAPAGAYTVSWRVVSSDSHPIEGTFTFTATSGSGGSPTAAGTGSASASGPASSAVATSAAVPTLGTVPPGATTAPQPVATSSAEPFPWSIVGFAVVALGLLVALAIMARRRLRADDEDSA